MVRKARWLWIVVVLMGLSLFGTIYIQYNLIQSTIKTTREKFEKEVFAALTNTIKSTVNETSFQEARAKQDSDGDESWRLTDLIVLPSLDYLLRQNLRKRGVDGDYRYGVYSFDREDYVIMDGTYAVSIGDEVEASVASRAGKLQESPFRADIFAMDTSALGELVLFFPKQGGEIFNNVVRQIIAALFFILLILFCFGYTVHIIMAQKQLSLVRTDFINNMTHEFKTPIATISLAADSMMNPMIRDSDERLDGFIDIIRTENNRIREHVEAVLQIAKLDRSGLKLNLKSINILDLIDACVDHFALRLAKRGGSIDVITESDEVIMSGDETHLTNLLHNLLDNALKYVTDVPEVKVKVEEDGRHVKISVVDNGIGMSKEQQRHIFDRFYRVPTGDVHNVKGFGLGLAYAKAIVEGHKGNIEVISELKKGSNFILTLPKAQE